MGIAGLINYTYYSKGQSIISPKELIINAKRKGYQLLALTDLNSLTAIPAFTELAYIYKIKPLTGMTVIVEHNVNQGSYLIPVSIVCKNRGAYKSLVKLQSKIPPRGIISNQILRNANLNGTASLIGGNPNLMANIIENDNTANLVKPVLEALRGANSEPYLTIDLYSYENYPVLLKSLADELSLSMVFANGVRYDKMHDFSALDDLISLLSEGGKVPEYILNERDKSGEYRLSSSYLLSEDELSDLPTLFQEYIKSAEVLAESCKPAFNHADLFRFGGEDISGGIAKVLIREARQISHEKKIIAYSPYSFQAKSKYSFLYDYSDDYPLIVEQGQHENIINSLSKKHDDIILSYASTYSVLDGYVVFKAVMDKHHISEDRMRELYEQVKDKPRLLEEDLANVFFTGEEKIALRNYDIIKQCPYHIVPDITGYMVFNKEMMSILPFKKHKNIINFIDYNMGELSESNKLLLNLKQVTSLNLIREIEELIRKNKPEDTANIEELMISDIKPENERVLNLMARGLTESVFILEEIGRSKPSSLRMIESIWDVACLISGYNRNNMEKLNRFSLAKKGEGIINVFDEELKKLLEPSSGLIFYQEQAVYLLSRFGGFDRHRIDILFDAIDNRDEKLVEGMKGDFLLYASSDEREHKLMRQTAEILFDNIVSAVERKLVSMSYALAIALIAYRFAELKLRYPLFFYTSALNLNLNRHDKLQRLIEEARDFGIDIVPLDINKSDKGFTVSGGKILMGLSVMLNIEEEVVNEIIQVRDKSEGFKGISHFCSKINVKNLTKTLVEDLICAGAFDFTGDKRSAMFSAVKDIIKNSRKTKEDEGSSQFSLLSSDKTKDLMLDSANSLINNNMEEWDIGTRLRNEKDACGFYITEHPISKYTKSTMRGDVLSITEAKQVIEGDIDILGLITRVEERISKSGRPWCKVRVEDTEDAIDVLVFNRTYGEVKPKLEEGKVYIFHGKVSDDQKKSIFLNSISEPAKPFKKRPKDAKTTQINKNPQLQLNDNIKTIEEKERKDGSVFKILIRERLVDYDVLIRLKTFLEKFKGDMEVHFLLSRFENDTQPIEIKSDGVKVTGDSNMQYQLLNEFGEYVKRVWSE